MGCGGMHTNTALAAQQEYWNCMHGRTCAYEIFPPLMLTSGMQLRMHNLIGLQAKIALCLPLFSSSIYRDYSLQHLLFIALLCLIVACVVDTAGT